MTSQLLQAITEKSEQLLKCSALEALAAVRSLNSLLSEAERQHYEFPRSDVDVICALESETDCFPEGEVRKKWSEDALKVKDAQLHRFVREDHGVLMESCRNIARVARRLLQQPR